MEEINKAIRILEQGGIVIFPTDTAFGIGCRIDDKEAVARLFKLRRRPVTQATPVLTASLKMVEKYLKPVPEEVITKLMEPHWPGGLTIVLQCKPELVSDLIRGGTETMGIRVPDHLTTLELINGVNEPIIGTSANFSGEKTPYRFEDLDPELTKLVDYIVPGECHAKLASTVINCTVKPWKILRQGAVELRDEY